LSQPGKKKVLIITYYWPPSGGSPVIRWLKFAKYLPQFGWEPVIYTPENPVPQAYDDSLLADIPDGTFVLTQKIKEPANWFGLKKISRNKTQSTAFISESGKKSIFSELAIWIRGNFFIPDARKCWINLSYRFLKKKIKEGNFDAIITTGPPHSMHLIGYKLKLKTGIPWLADFRDPWTKIDYYHQLKLGRCADSKHHKQERKVLQTADAVVTVGPTMTSEFRDMGCSNVYTITNGFDIIPEKAETGKIESFKILHVGSMPLSRNPENLWPVLKQMVEEDSNFKNDLIIECIGKVDFEILKQIESNGLSGNLKQTSHLPNEQAIREMQTAAVLLLVINNSQNSKGILTNKFFEYLSVNRPILAIGPEDGDVAEILKETGAGSIVDYSNSERFKSILKEYYIAYKENRLPVTLNSIEKFSRKNLTQQLVTIIDKISK
jgi:hypothetical protein